MKRANLTNNRAKRKNNLAKRRSEKRAAKRQWLPVSGQGELLEPPRPAPRQRRPLPTRMLQWLGQKLVGPPRATHKDRHLLVALVITSLIAGLLLLLNLDRSIHRVAGARIGPGVSLHGWPLIYLQRTVKPESVLIAGRANDWPWPTSVNETRSYDWQNAGLNCAIALLTLVLVYWTTRWSVLRYDRWKASW